MNDLWNEDGFRCCQVEESACVCDSTERGLRAYMNGYAPRPMTPEEREYCLAEGEHDYEGAEHREDAENLSDKDLAHWTFWGMVAYVKSNCL